MKVYQAMYVNDPESGYITISIHKTKQGARNALAKYIVEEIRPREHKLLGSYKMYYWLDYFIKEVELLD